MWKKLAENKEISVRDEVARSSELNTDCLRVADRMLVTPIDREDIAYFSFALHRFNQCTSDLYLYKKSFFPDSDLKDSATAVHTVCERVWKVFRDGLPTSPHNTWEGIPTLSNFQCDNRFSPLRSVAQYNMFLKTERCFFKICDIHDRIYITAIKNA